LDPQIYDLYSQILNSDRTVPEKKAMWNEVRKLMSPDDNRWNFRYVVIPLALLALAVPIYAFTLAFRDQPVDIPQALNSLGSAGVGALAAFLTQYSQSRRGVPAETPASVPGSAYQTAPAQTAKATDSHET
jgi:hypothetical protein